MLKSIKKINSLLTFKKTSRLNILVNSLKMKLNETKSFSYNKNNYILDSKSKNTIKKTLNSKFFFNQVDYFINEAKILNKINLDDNNRNKLFLSYLATIIFQNAKCNNDSIPYLFLMSLIDDANNSFKDDKYLLDLFDKYNILPHDFKNHILKICYIIKKQIDTSNYSASNSYYMSWIYLILKRQQSLVISNSKKNIAVINVKDYNVLSEILMNIISDVKSNYCMQFDSLDKDYISKITDMDVKLWLKDESKLTFWGWVNLFVSYAILIFWAVVILYPIYLLISKSFNGNIRTTFETRDQFNFSTSNFSYLFSDTLFSTWLMNTIKVALITMVLVVSLTALMAYAYSRYRFTGKKSTLITVMILQMFPSVAALAVLSIYYTLIKQEIGFPPYIALVFIYSGGAIFGNTFVIKGYMDGISREIDDAARIDGCSSIKTFYKIILPLCKPIIAVVCLWSFIGPFGDFLLPNLLIRENDQLTVAAGLKSLTVPQGQDNSSVNYGAFTAGSLLISVPIVILFLYLQRFIRSGATDGGVK